MSAAFDWDKESAPAASHGDFDWATESTPHPDEGPGELESGLRGAAQGATLGFADELAGAGSALVDKLKGDNRSLEDLYRAERDDSRAKFDAAQKANPLSYGAGNLLGSGATQAALAGLTGGTSLGALAAQGALSGGLQSLGDSTAKDAGGDLENAAVRAGLGGLFGVGGGLAGRAAGAALRKVSPALAEKLDALAASQARKALNGGANSLSTAKDISREQLLDVLDKGGIKAFDTVGKTAERLDQMAGNAGQDYADTVRALEEAGVNGPETGPLAQHFSDTADQLEQNTLGSAAPGEYRARAEELASKGVNDAGELSLTQAENIKRSAQEKARAQYKALTGTGTELGDAHTDIASQLRAAIENKVADAGEQARAALESGALTPEQATKAQQIAENAARFEPIKKDVGTLIAARNLAEKGAQQAERRSTFGLRNAVVAGPALATSIATGNPLPLLAPVAQHIAATRGAATTAVVSRSLSKSLGKVAAAAGTNPAALGKFGGVMASALANGRDSFNAAHFVLSANPEYQKTVNDLHSSADSDGGSP